MSKRELNVTRTIRKKIFHRVSAAFTTGAILFFVTEILMTPPPLLGSESFGSATLTEVAPRVITPNGDFKNDAAFFRFDSPLSGLPLETAVYDINGAKVSALSLDSTETALMWDGKDDQGKVMPSGIYIYSIKIGKNMATGTLVVAR